MNAKTSKLLRKVAKLSGRTDTYIKKTFKEMPPERKVAYIAFMKENLRRIEQIQKQVDPTQTTVTDIPRRVAREL